MASSERNHFPGEAQEAAVFLSQRPINPTDFVVLAPGIVIAALRPQELVAGQEHGDALRQQQGRHYIAGLPLAESAHDRVGRRSFDTAIPGPIGVGTVPAFLAVGGVVLFLV
jgi:hypothetical protein